MKTTGFNGWAIYLTLCLLWQGGCAFGTRHVNLTYPPDNKASLGTATAEATEAEGSGKPILFVKFSDMRGDREKVGHVRNGFGMKTAKVVADNDVTQWVNQAILQQLKQVGFKVKAVDMKEVATTH